MRRSLPLLLALSGWTLLLSAGLAADVTSTWNGTTGNWSDATRWNNSPSVLQFPNNGNGGFTYDAIINSGTVTLDLSVVVEAFTIGGGILSGSNDLTTNQLTTFNYGTMSGAGTTFAAGGLTLGTNGSKTLDGGRTLVNQATATWSDGQINLNSSGAADSGIFINALGGVFNNSFNGSLLVSSFGGDTGVNARFDNLGTFRKSGGTGTTAIDARFNNTGTVEVQTGTLDLPGATQSHNLAGVLTGGAWRAISTAGSATLKFSGSNISRIAADTTVELSGSASAVQVVTTPLQNTLNRNDGTLRIFDDHDFAPLATTFINAGALELGGSGLADGVFNAAGILQNDGTIRGHGELNGGQVNSSGPIEGDSDTRLVRFNGPLSGAGPLKNVEINSIHAPGADVGEVDLEGLYSLTSNAVLAIDIGQAVTGIEHDRLSSTGTVQLAGHLQLSVLNLGGGALLPSVSQQFPLITSTGIITGSFAESMIITFASGVETHWSILYSSTEVALEATEVFAIPGDYNRDNSADAADYVWWRKALGTSFLSADGNQNGVVDDGDYDVWREHFGESVATGLSAEALNAAVPEPRSLALLALAAATVLLNGCRVAAKNRC